MSKQPRHVPQKEGVSSVCRGLSQLDLQDTMNKQQAQARGKLKQEVVEILQQHPFGVKQSAIWNLVTRKFKHQVACHSYGLDKMKKIFDYWDDIETFKCPDSGISKLRMKALDTGQSATAENQPRQMPLALPESRASTSSAYMAFKESLLPKQTGIEDFIKSHGGSVSLDFLKKDVLYALDSYPDGVLKSNLWKVVQSLTGRQVNLKKFGVFTETSHILEAFHDDIEQLRDVSGRTLLRRRRRTADTIDHNGSGNGASNSSVRQEAPERSQTGLSAIECMKLAGQKPQQQHHDEDDYEDDDDDCEDVKGARAVYDLQSQETIDYARNGVIQLLSDTPALSYKQLRKRLKKHIKKGKRIKIAGAAMDDLIKNKLNDILLFDGGNRQMAVSLNTSVLEREEGTARAGPSAIELMQRANTAHGGRSNKQQGDQVIDLTARGSSADRESHNQSQDFISFEDDGASRPSSKKTPDVIDLTDSAMDDQPVTNVSAAAGMPARMPVPLLGPAVFLGPSIGNAPTKNLLAQPLQNFFQGRFPLQQSGLMGQPPSLMGPAPRFNTAQQAQASTAASKINFLGPAVQPANNVSTGSNQPSQLLPHPSPSSSVVKSMPGPRDFVEDLTVKPVEVKEFEQKEIVVRPVYLARGERPQPQYVDNIAKECIELLADANEFVSQNRIEKLLLQRFQCHHLNMLGFRYIDQIPCVNELNRLVSKVNAYILAFVKTRSICTLFELREALREYVPNKGDFTELKLGPLHRFPVVFQNFKFPPDQCEVPEISSMAVLEHFRNYLSQYNLWTTRLELEPFMNYLVKLYSAPDAYILGVRIRSLPLAAAVLKKAQRDTGANRREILDHFKENLKSDIEDAFRKFRASILQTSGEGMEVRRHYLKMRPELVIPEIFEKFKLLMELVEMSSSRERKLGRIITEFVDQVTHDGVVRALLHLSICMSNTALEETAMAVIAKPEVITLDDDSDEVKATQGKPPPAKDELIQSLTMYMERCLHSGSFSLPLLSKIEENLLSNFGYSAFSQMGHGRFLEFLLAETKQLLDEAGGLSLGSGGASGGDTEQACRPHLRDIFDFIQQCQQAGLSQPSEIENALCRHYNVKEARLLGYGHMTRLMTRLQKMMERRSHQVSDHVFYETAMAPGKGVIGGEMKVGVLGHQTVDLAKICLHNCPLLEDLSQWSQWPLVFEPELGKLKDFIDKYGGQSNKHLEGGRLATLDFLGLEVAPGRLLKLVSNTSPDQFTEALATHDDVAVSGHLVSMVVSFKGVANMPLALLASHMKTSLLQMHAGDGEPVVPGAPATAPPQNVACQFVLRSLLHIPTQICVALANQVFLEPLGQVVGSTTSKQLLIRMCTSVHDLNRMIELGCKLGVNEWSAMMMQQKCHLPETAIQILPPDVEEFFETSIQQQAEEEESEESDMDDVDEILEGDIGMEGQLKVGRLRQTEEKKLAEEGEAMQAVPSGTSRADGGKMADTDVEATTSAAGETADTDVDEARAEKVESKVEDEEGDVVMGEEDGPVSSQQRCEEIVHQIRKEEFGIGVHLGEDGERLMKVQQARLGRSLDRLSKDLYSKDTHFVLELVQNADDNNYSEDLLNCIGGVCPSVKFIMDTGGITVLNNEQGFEEINIRALCDVGRSTKGKHKFGYIGQKGIGFKSVFRITDSPEVHSNGFHIKFDVNSGPMGYILPHWVEPESDPSDSQWMTKIVLRLKPDMVHQTRTLASRFNDIHPALLLFLHRLREITVENKVEQTVQKMCRKDVGEHVVEITHMHGRTERWLVVKRMLDASKVSSQAKSGAEVESTEIALAFPLPSRGQMYQAQVLPEKQPVFAFLPLRSYGLRFIVQGDFDVPSSREDVDRDSPWNQWLRTEVHALFLDALDVFKSHEEFSSIEAVCSFLQFVPMEDEVLDFFKPVATDILKKLRAKPCVPTQPNEQGTISWKLPSQTVRVRDPIVRSVVTPELLQKHLNLSYLHPDVVSLLNPTLTSCLGIETLTTDHLYQLGSALLVNMGSKCGPQDVVLIAKWLACMYRNLDEYRDNDAVLSSLKALRMLPLSDGELISLQQMVVFFPITKESASSKNERDPLLRLQQDVNSLHPLLLNTGDAEVNSQVQKLLVRLDVKQLSPTDVIHSHIIPVLKSDKWKTKSDGTIMSYLVYIKEQMDKQPSLCKMEELKEVVQVITSDGRQNPSTSLVHFPSCYGNPLDLPKQFPGYKWTLLSPQYLPVQCSSHQMNSWHNFFARLGVEDFLSLKQRDVHLTRESMATSVWSSASEMWPKTEEEFIIQDWHSAELESLIQHNLCPDGDVYQQQMRTLFEQLDRSWESRFSRCTMTQVFDKQRKPLRDVPSSFSILLQTSSWIPAVKCQSVFDEGTGTIHLMKEIVLQEPSQVYVRSEIVERLLVQKVLYLNVPSTTGPFCQFLGLKRSVSIEAMKGLLLEWSRRDKSSSAPTPVQFCTSLEHIKCVYRYLSEQLSRQDFKTILQEEPVIFVPDRNKGRMSEYSTDVRGHFLHKSEVWMADRTRLFDKHRGLLEEFHSDICRKRTIQEYYQDSQDILDLFRQEGRISSQPEIKEYLELLELLCSTSTPKETRILSDVLYILTVVGQFISILPEGMPSEAMARSTLETYKTFVKNRLEKQKVFPTKKQIWVSLEDQPILADHRAWEKLFEGNPDVHFLDLEDKAAQKPNRAPRYPRAPRPGTESHVNPEMIGALMDALEVPRLSESVDMMPIPNVLEPCPQLQGFLHKVVPSVQQYLAANFDQVYEELKQMNFQAMLLEAKFYQTSSLEVRYTISALKKDVYVIKDEKCVIQLPTFFFHLDHLSSSNEINYEIARAFSTNHNDCNHGLRSFLMELSNVVSGGTSTTEEDLLRQHDANIVSIPAAEKWFVPPPPAPRVVKPKSPEPIQDVQPEMDVYGHSHGQARDQQGPQEMRAWPPVARDGNRPVMKKESDEQPRSNIWPPPQAKDYMRSVRDLPAGVRVLGPEDASTQQGTSALGNAGLGTSKHEVAGSADRQPGAPGPSAVAEVTRKRKLSGDTSEDNLVKRSSGDHSSTVIEERPSGVTERGQGHSGEVGVSGQSQSDSLRRGGLSQGNQGGEPMAGHNHTGERQPDTQVNRPEGQRPHGDMDRHAGQLEVMGRSNINNQERTNIRGDPIWSYMATDYTYDELAEGRDLHMPDTIQLTEGSSDSAVGAWGEALVAAYLQRQKEAGNIVDFIWQNFTNETGSPFDFEVRYQDERGVHTDYIEVKSTVSSDKEVFEISVQQIKFATEMKGNFHIYRVFNAGDPESVRLIRIHDLNARLSAKQVKLCMLI